jgi:hypothetical protein
LRRPGQTNYRSEQKRELTDPSTQYRHNPLPPFRTTLTGSRMISHVIAITTTASTAMPRFTLGDNLGRYEDSRERADLDADPA